jgi:hypothetical protein
MCSFSDQTWGTFVSRKFSDGLGKNVFCHRFVFARSLLSKCVMYLSPWTKIHYAFQAKQREWGDHVKYEPIEDYPQKILDNAWRNTPNQ